MQIQYFYVQITKILEILQNENNDPAIYHPNEFNTASMNNT